MAITKPLKEIKPMDPEVKRKWVKALRSGKYKQGFGRLRTKDDCFCVLGVLCNIHAQHHPELAKKQKDSLRYLGASHSLPSEVVKWAGLSSLDPVIGSGGTQRSLISLNDNTRLSFKELAAAIEFSTL